MDIEIRKGQGIIDILSSDDATCLLIEKPIMFTLDNEYYAISDSSGAMRKKYTEGLDEVLFDGSEEEQDESIKNFLNIFKNGVYKIHKYDSVLKHTDFVGGENKYSKEVPVTKRFYGRYHEDFLENYHFTTIKDSEINDDKVNHYVEQIKSGKRPTIVLFGFYDENDFDVSFVLTGHHIIRAYVKLKIAIPTIYIEKLNQVKTERETFLMTSKKILRDFEFERLVYSDLTTINLYSNPVLKSSFDSLLMKTNKLTTEIVRLLMKIDTSNTKTEREWLEERLNIIYRNKNLGKNLQLAFLDYSEVIGKDYWSHMEIKSKKDFNKWIVKVLPNSKKKKISFWDTLKHFEGIWTK